MREPRKVKGITRRGNRNRNDDRSKIRKVEVRAYRGSLTIPILVAVTVRMFLVPHVVSQRTVKETDQRNGVNVAAQPPQPDRVTACICAHYSSVIITILCTGLASTWLESNILGFLG
jgi:hypothetical protein